MRSLPFHSPLLLIGTALAITAAPAALRAEIVFERSGATTNAVVVAPYPGLGTNFISWLLTGSPGAWITTFEPTTNEIIRSVTIEMDDAAVDSEPLADAAPEGGFSLSLCQIDQSVPGVISIEIITVLEGSDNPVEEGSYTYTVPEGLELRGPHALLAMVEPTGGQFRWKQTAAPTGIGSGITAAVVLTNQLASITIDVPLDLNNVTILIVDNGSSASPVFRVEADDRYPGLSVTPARRFAPTTIGEETEAQQIKIRNTGKAPLTGLAVRANTETRRHFDISQPKSRSLAAGTETEFPVSFRPRKPGRISGSLTVVGSAGTAKIRLRGRGVTPPVQPPIREPRNVE
jgi:hypothetical protein